MFGTACALDGWKKRLLGLVLGHSLGTLHMSWILLAHFPLMLVEAFVGLGILGLYT